MDPPCKQFKEGTFVFPDFGDWDVLKPGWLGNLAWNKVSTLVYPGAASPWVPLKAVG